MSRKKRAHKKHLLKSKIGIPPGTLVYVGHREIEKCKIMYVEYDTENLLMKSINTLDEIKKIAEQPPDNKVRWININGLSDTEFISEIANLFMIHSLTIEDVLNSYHQPKVEIYDNSIFTVLKKIEFAAGHELKIEHVCLIMFENLLISFQDVEENIFSGVYDRIEKNKGIIRKSKTNYLYYVLMDQIVDQYFVLMEEFSEKIELLEEELLQNPSTEELSKIQNLRKDLQEIRHYSRPVREVLNSIIRGDSDLISENLFIYFRDTLDHQINIMETSESLRDSLSTLMDIYLSSISNRMNEVMKVLTIIATIFIPLTFLAGIYGMNFDKMPELHWEYGYFAALGGMILIGISLGYYFKRKKWL